MINKEQLTMTGTIHIEKTFGCDGHIENYIYKNLVVTSGKIFTVSRMLNNTNAVMSYIGVGASPIVPSLSDTDLIAMIGVRGIMSSAVQHANVVTYSAAFLTGVSTGAISEAGIFNDPIAGSMLCRTVFPVVNKEPLDSINITWAITLA
jgi:hypothetical protein